MRLLFENPVGALIAFLVDRLGQIPGPISGEILSPSYEVTAGWRFVRFHYGSRGRGGNYSASELEQWARRIAQWRRQTDVYAYFNNDWRGFAPANARDLRRRLR